MNVSVLIPTYNSASVIRMTLDSVLRQTVAPAEILIMDDGSTDETISILESYKPRVFVFQQQNRGVAAARNELCRRANGDLIAFLDHDDIWHPQYLENQATLHSAYPTAAAVFTGHIDFRGYDTYEWSKNSDGAEDTVELIDPLSFAVRYNASPGCFASMSYCCISKNILNQMGAAPFAVDVSGADDFCLCNQLPLFGSVVYSSRPLVAYRIIKEAQSSNRLKGVALSIRSFEILCNEYQRQQQKALTCVFFKAFASKKRTYAKLLMGADLKIEAKRQIFGALVLRGGITSFIKSFILLCLVSLPRQFQPSWPKGQRE